MVCPNKFVNAKNKDKINMVFIILGKVKNTFGLKETFRYNYAKSILNSGFNGFYKKALAIIIYINKAT